MPLNPTATFGFIRWCRILLRVAKDSARRFLLSAEVIISNLSILIWLNPPPCFVFAHKPLQSAHLDFPFCSLSHLAHTRSASPCVRLSVSVSLSLCSFYLSCVVIFYKASQKRQLVFSMLHPWFLFLSKQQVNRWSLGCSFCWRNMLVALMDPRVKSTYSTLM